VTFIIAWVLILLWMVVSYGRHPSLLFVRNGFFQQNETVAKDLTNTIKSFCTSDEMKKLTSSRSLCAGGITAHKSNFYVPEACVANAAGLSFGILTDNYFKSGPDLVIISANALCDWPFPMTTACSSTIA
jgi:hypothetical protein